VTVVSRQRSRSLSVAAVNVTGNCCSLIGTWAPVNLRCQISERGDARTISAHTWLVGTWLVLSALVIGALGAVRLRRLAAAPAAGAAAAQEVPSDLADLDEAFDRLLADHSHELGVLLSSRLRQLVHRRVPVRAIRQAPGERTVRVCFADGTVVLARGHAPGDFAKVAWALHARPVRLVGFSSDEAGTHLDFRWSPDQRIAAFAVGLDQPD
jgi:hypothetical protein